MPDENQTGSESTSTSEETSTATTVATGTQAPEGFVPRAELEKAQAQASSFQSRADQLAAKVREFEKPATEKTTTTETTAADPAAMFAAMERRMELREARVEFRSDDRFATADPSLFARATEYDSREAFEAALLESAESRKTERETVRSEVLKEVLADLQTKYPDLKIGDAAPPSNQGGGAATDGQMTPDKLVAMPQAEFEAWVSKNPDEYARVLSAAS